MPPSIQLGGHTTALAHDGLTALAAAAEFRPDVVLLDLGLPGMNGYEVARAIQARPEPARPFFGGGYGLGRPRRPLEIERSRIR